MWHKRKEADVLIVGAGPVGLCAAVSIARRGLRPLVIDSRWKEMHRAGAVVLHPQSLALLGELGVVHGLLGEGARVDHVRFYDEEGTRHAELDMSGLEEPYPFALVVPHQLLIHHLAEALASRDMPVKWHHRLDSLEMGDERVVAHVDELDRESVGYAVQHMEEVVERSRRYKVLRVVGADGEDSVVRRSLGSRWQQVGAEGVRVVFEASSSWAAGEEARIVFGNDGISTLFPLPHDRVQWSFFVDGGTHSEDRLTMDDLRSFLRSRAPWFDATVREIEWAAVLPYSGHISSERGRGNIWLVGDATHTASPIVDYPLNTDLAEAHDVAGRIASSIQGDDASMEGVTRTAEAFAQQMQAFIDPAGRFVADSGADQWVRENADRLVQCIPARLGEQDAIAAQVGLHPASR